MQLKVLYSKTEVARSIGVSDRTVDKLVAEKKIRSVRVGSRRLFDIEDVKADLKAGNAEPVK